MIIRLLIFGFLLPVATLRAQSAELEDLLASAVATWPDLITRRAELAAATYQVQEAERAFRPIVSFGGTYTLAAGGRSINLPLGDLLNPVYGTLNQLTASENFPQLENQEEALLPNNFYDIRARAQVPILDPATKRLGRRAALGKANAELATEVTKADLRYAVRASYYQVLSAQEGLRVLQSADSTIAEALRTTVSLIRNDLALPLARERILAERSEITAQRATLRAQLANARAQLQFYVGTELPETLGDPTGVAPEPGGMGDMPNLSADGAQRPEIRQLQTAREVTLLDLEVEERFRQPRLGVQIDVGSQDFNFGVEPYALAGLTLNIPLYDGGRHGLRGQKLRAEAAAAQSRIEAASRGIELERTVAANEVEAARARYAAFTPAISAAARTLNDAQILYRNDGATYLELVDARQQLTRVRLRRNVAFYEVLIRRAAWLRAVGG